MATNHDHRKRVDAILARAGELAASNETRPEAGDAELLAALADGTLSLSELDDDTLERCVQTYGADSVVGALLRSAGTPSAADAAPQLKPREVLTMPRDTDMALRRKAAPAPPVWWRQQPAWILAAAASLLIVAGAVYWRSQAPAPVEVAQLNLALDWPSESPFDPAAGGVWGLPHAPLPRDMPDFARSVGTLGAGRNNEQLNRWRRATVIIRSEDGWGSGAVISADGWLLSNYHVVANQAQTAAVTGRPAKVEVITAEITRGQAKPRAALTATLYRADPTRDLALLKLDALPAGVTELPFFPLGSQVEDGEDCFVIGSQHNGPAWWVRSGTVSLQFDFPDDLSQVAAGVASSGASLERNRVSVVVSDARVSPGDSGGPLLNPSGQLIGLTFATSANASAGSVGWHIALPHLRSFLAEMPARPEGVPFDPWTAGLPQAHPVEPELADADHDGKPDSLHYRYVVAAPDESGQVALRPVAVTIYVDFSERAVRTDDPLERLPFGLWGMEGRGRFRFNLFLSTRADGVTAVGYPGSDGVVDEIRIGRAGQGTATVVWQREKNGQWRSSAPTAAVPLVDPQRVGQSNLGRLQAIAGRIVRVPRGTPRVPERQSPGVPEPSGGKGPNKI